MNDIKIQSRYYIKSVFGTLVGSIISLTILALVFGFQFSLGGAISLLIYGGLIFFGSIISVIVMLIWIRFFSYRFGDDYIEAKQGIISRQERHLPYVVIQTVIIKQDIFDRLFHLSTIVVENASFGGVGMPAQNSNYYGGGNMYGGYRNVNSVSAMMGMHGNRFVLSGINEADAEKLRDWLLDKAIKVINKQTHQEL